MLSDEPDIADPWHFTFLDTLKKTGDINKEENLDRLIKTLKSGKIYSTFWKDFSQSKIDFETIRERIKKSNKTGKEIFSIIIDEYRKLSGKPVVGAKYPVHPSKSQLLFEWYPDAKYIFLIRNIFASATSRINDEATTRRKKKAGIFSFLVHYFTLIWFLTDFNLASKAYKKNKEKFLLIKYEDLIINFNDTLKLICEHLGVQVEENMFRAFGKPSSYNGKIQRGAAKERVNNWRHKIRKLDYLIIKVFTFRSRKVFGY